jgi:hypothetical protein
MEERNIVESRVRDTTTNGWAVELMNSHYDRCAVPQKRLRLGGSLAPPGSRF